MNNNRVILTDVDGVLLNWEEGFAVWMEHQGHIPNPDHKSWYDMNKHYDLSRNQIFKLIMEFIDSAAIGFLPPLRDAQVGVQTLTKQGYRFVAVTSVGNGDKVKALRERNLAKLFGKDTFKDVICLDLGGCKRDALSQLAKQYKGNYWIEDKIENLDVGVERGFTGLLMEHKFNMHYEGAGRIVKNWHDIVNIIHTDNA